MRITPIRLVLGVLLANLAAHWVMSLCYSIEPHGSPKDWAFEWHALGWFHWSGRLILHSCMLWWHWDWVTGVFMSAAEEARKLRKVA